MKEKGKTKSEKVWTSLLFTFSLLIFTSLVARAATIDVTQANIEQYRTLQNGNTYRFAEYILLRAAATESALKVESGATVTLVVPSGVNVRLYGGAASGRTGAGAGIELPEDAKLYILGDSGSIIYAYGGNAAAGQDGKNGESAFIEDNDGDDNDWCHTGAGGAGGDGGGGAGAGIGGRGGNGGLGGTGGAGVTELAARKAYAGNAGGKGGDGTRGGNCGTVIVAETVRFGVGGGSAPDTAGSGGGFGYIYVKQWLWWYYAWGGGGGGGGGSGFAASGIGGGGGGGAGGGGGGSGMIDYYWSDPPDYRYENTETQGTGLGGTGGNGSVSGATGKDRGESFNTTNNLKGGAGGGSGAKGSSGAGGAQETLSSSVTVNGKNVLTCDGWAYDPVANKISLLKNELYLVLGDVQVSTVETKLWQVTLCGLPARRTLQVTGLDGLDSVTTDGNGEVAGLYLPARFEEYILTVGEGQFRFSVSTQDITPLAHYKVDVKIGAHISQVTYTVNGRNPVTESTDFTLPKVKSGSKIAFVDVVCEEGYSCFDAKELTVGTSNASIALTAARTDDFTNLAYCGADGKVVTAGAVKSIHPRMDRTIGGGNWYAIDANTAVETLTVNGTANLILVDGTTLTVNGGIRVEGDNALNIYGQGAGTGRLITNGSGGCAGIGGGRGAYVSELQVLVSRDIVLKSEDGGSCGAVTIYGGVVTAKGGNGGAGIGGGRGGKGSEHAKALHIGADIMPELHEFFWNYPYNRGMSGGACGTVTINGGTVTAMGGKGGAGIGGGCGGAGGDGVVPGKYDLVGGYYWRYCSDGGNGGTGGTGGVVTINGGTVMAMGADGAVGIGGGNGGNAGNAGDISYKDGVGGARGEDATVTINGGSVRASEIRNAPKNKAGELLYKVTVECENLGGLGGLVSLEGLDGYGTRDVYPIDGRVYLWLPDGTHSFKISDGPTTLRYCAIVKGRDVTVEPLPPVVRVGFFVNGTDVGEGPGPDWKYVNNVLTLARDAEYVLSGTALNNEVQINSLADGARIVLSNAVVITSGRAALEVGQNVSLLMAGDTSYLMTTNGASAVTVAECATLTVDLGPGGDRLESMICVFGFEKSAIGGGGAAEVNGGTLFAWSDEPAFAFGTTLNCGEGVVMKTGVDPETATIATKFDEVGDAPCVLVAPAVTVTVANDIPHVSNITVSNAVEQIEGEEIGDSMIYRVMLEDDVFVGYAVEAGYVSQVPNPLVYFAVEDENITIDAEVLKVVAPVAPGQAAGPFATPEAAAEAAEVAEFTPSDEVAEALGTDEALATYRDMFTFEVVKTEDGQWAVEAVLTPEAESNLVENASAATRQIPVGDIAALGSGEPTEVTVGGCVPGFYYTLYGAAGVRALPMGDALPTTEATAYGPVLCEPDTPVTFEAVEKPSETAGFFSIGVTVSDVDVWLRENPDGQDDEELYGPHIE